MSKHLVWIRQSIDLAVAAALVCPPVKQVLSRRVRQWIFKQRENLRSSPPVGWVRFGNFRRVKPISTVFGFDRGLPIDRYYIEGFLSANRSDIQGNVLEVAENKYTLMFGGERVSRSDVLHVCEGNPNATIVADLTSGDTLPSQYFDCVILTQTLQFIYELRAAIRTLHRILKPGGVLLATCPGISQISRYDMDRWGDHWRFTTLSARKLFEEVFSPSEIRIESYGNVLAAASLLQGLAVEDLRRDELENHDADYELIVAIRAVKLQENRYRDSKDRHGRAVRHNELMPTEKGNASAAPRI